MPELRRSTSGGNGVLEMTNENFARLLKGLTIAVGNRKNRILFYQFLAAEIRALHYSYGIGDGESYKRALKFLEDCDSFHGMSLILPLHCRIVIFSLRIRNTLIGQCS
jgi:hypothetical protein